MENEALHCAEKGRGVLLVLGERMGKKEGKGGGKRGRGKIQGK